MDHPDAQIILYARYVRERIVAGDPPALMRRAVIDASGNEAV
jgi:hypothetical protein